MKRLNHLIAIIKLMTNIRDLVAFSIIFNWNKPPMTFVLGESVSGNDVSRIISDDETSKVL